MGVPDCNHDCVSGCLWMCIRRYHSVPEVVSECLDSVPKDWISVSMVSCNPGCENV